MFFGSLLTLWACQWHDNGTSVIWLTVAIRLVTLIWTPCFHPIHPAKKLLFLATFSRYLVAHKLILQHVQAIYFKNPRSSTFCNSHHASPMLSVFFLKPNSVKPFHFSRSKMDLLSSPSFHHISPLTRSRSDVRSSAMKRFAIQSCSYPQSSDPTRSPVSRRNAVILEDSLVPPTDTEVATWLDLSRNPVRW